MKSLLSKFAKDESGAALVEYSLLIGLITAAVVLAAIFVGGWVGAQWGALETDLATTPIQAP